MLNNSISIRSNEINTDSCLFITQTKKNNLQTIFFNFFPKKIRLKENKMTSIAHIPKLKLTHSSDHTKTCAYFHKLYWIECSPPSCIWHLRLTFCFVICFRFICVSFENDWNTFSVDWNNNKKTKCIHFGIRWFLF